MHSNRILTMCLIVSLSINLLLVLELNVFSFVKDTTQINVSTLAQEISGSRPSILSDDLQDIHSVKLDSKSRPVLDSKSITSVGVMPILVRDGLFEKTIYEGTNIDISVSVKDGRGMVLVNTEIPTGIDFQKSARIAVKASEEYLGVDLSDKDIVFLISAEDNSKLKAVDGHSAGAAMTILLVSELSGKELRDDVVITGTIESGFKIGKVGGIYEKAQAAGKSGATIFLVPKNQDVTFVESCQESISNSIIYRSCQMEQKPLSPKTEKLFGMKVVSVESISDALSYFLIDS